MPDRFKWLVVSVAAGFFCISALLFWQIDPARVRFFAREDGPLEYPSFAFYLLAAAYMAGAAVRAREKRFFLWSYALLFFLIADEEITWAQRILGFHTPQELKAINVQGEFTIHNIEGLFQNVRMIGLLVVGEICFVIPILHASSSVFRGLFQRLGMPIFPLWASGLVTACILFMAVPQMRYTYGIPAMDEVGEFLLSTAMSLFGIAIFRDAARPRSAGSLPHRLHGLPRPDRAGPRT